MTFLKTTSSMDFIFLKCIPTNKLDDKYLRIRWINCQWNFVWLVMNWETLLTKYAISDQMVIIYCIYLIVCLNFVTSSSPKNSLSCEKSILHSIGIVAGFIFSKSRFLNKFPNHIFLINLLLQQDKSSNQHGSDVDA